MIVHVDYGLRAPFRRCQHRHKTLHAARRCAAEHGLLPSQAARLVVVNEMHVVVHVELLDGSRVAGEPFAPKEAPQ